MKKLFRSVFGVFLLSAALALGGTAYADDDDDDDDDDGGGGSNNAVAFGDFVPTYGGPGQHVDFSAEDGGLLGPDSGSITYTNSNLPVTYTADLICVSIVGNIARFGYIIPTGTGFGLDGLNIIFEVIDNDGNQMPDTVVGDVEVDQSAFIQAPALTCDAVDLQTTPIYDGDIVVLMAGLGGGGGDDDDDDDDDEEDDDDDD